MREGSKEFMKKHYEALKANPGRVLDDCYTNPSDKKWNAFYSCVVWAVEHEAECWGITSFNTQNFTFTTLLRDTVVVDTYQNTYYYPLGLLEQEG